MPGPCCVTISWHTGIKKKYPQNDLWEFRLVWLREAKDRGNTGSAPKSTLTEVQNGAGLVSRAIIRHAKQTHYTYSHLCIHCLFTSSIQYLSKYDTLKWSTRRSATVFEKMKEASTCIYHLFQQFSDGLSISSGKLVMSRRFLNLHNAREHVESRIQRRGKKKWTRPKRL